MIIFTSQTMQEIIPILQNRLKYTTSVTFQVLNPDISEGYAGCKVVIDKQTYTHRGYKAWTDLAELLQCKMLTPKEGTYPYIQFTFIKLQDNSFHKENKHNEKYGTNSHFAQIHKMEEPAFFYYYNQALNNVNIRKRKRTLNLGVNRGDEFEVIKNKLNINEYENMEFIGVDHSESAISYAQKSFTENNVTFHAHDINALDALKLGQFDLLISIGTLQSPSIDFKPFFMKLVQEYLTKDAAIILGFPNSRWIGGEMLHGAKAPNYAMNEMSLILNDIMFCKKYLQQKKFRVTVTGKQYLFLTATKIGNEV